MTRVIHTGDTHLGYRQYHSPERREDFLAAFRRVIDDAIDDEVDAVVHAGDLFHDRNPSLSDIRGTIDILADLRAAEIPFLAVVGNHERMRGEQWLDLFESLDLATRLGREPLTLGEVAFYGLDFVPRSKRADLDYAFEPCGAEHAVLVSHGPFSPFVPAIRNDTWEIETVLGESSVAFDAVLLGDEHAPETREIDGVWVTYCGSTERTSAAEREERGYNIVEFDDGVSIARRGIETRPFVTIDLDLDDGEGIERVRERIREEPVEDAVVIVTVAGDGEEVPPARVEEFALDQGALIARVTDRRERGGEAEVAEVSFADPDEAVRDRLGGMGLSEAARAIDGVVRDDAVVKSNVRDRVSEEIADLVEGDPAAFAPATPEEDRPDHATDDGTTSTDEDKPPAEATADDDAIDEESPVETTEGDDATTDDDRPTDVESTTDENDDDEPPRSRATTMEEFL